MNTKSLISLWNHTQQHPGTSGARVCTAVLLGLYNGTRFPFDLTDLRGLDNALRMHALQVITDDATFCKMEVHSWLNHLSGRWDFGDAFEELAWEYNCFKKGRCKQSERLRPRTRFVFDLSEQSLMTGPVGLGARRQAAMTLAGITVVEDPTLLPDQAYVMQNGKRVATITHLHELDNLPQRG